MDHAAGKDENVEYRVMVGNAPGRIEDNAEGIGDAAGQDQHQRGDAHRHIQRLNGDDAYPPHREIRDNTGDIESFSEDDLHRDAEQRHRPDNGQQSRTEAAAYHKQKKRRIAAGDQKIYAAMVNDLEPLFDGRADGGVIEGGRGIERDQRRPINNAAYNMQSVPLINSERNQKDKADDAEN